LRRLLPPEMRTLTFSNLINAVVLCEYFVNFVPLWWESRVGFGLVLVKRLTSTTKAQSAQRRNCFVSSIRAFNIWTQLEDTKIRLEPCFPARFQESLLYSRIIRYAKRPPQVHIPVERRHEEGCSHDIAQSDRHQVGDEEVVPAYV
jgi:hypothetical protein